MKVTFTKMHGIGNDYIYFNCMEQELRRPEKLAVDLSDRHFGIGGDGIILICRSEIADARMRIFNTDGSEGRMCGNGIRCVAKYLYDNGIVQKECLSIETLSGVKNITLHIKNGKAERVCVDMGKVIFDPKAIPVALDGEAIINRSVDRAGQLFRITCVSMGNPHAVIFVDNTDITDLTFIGRLFGESTLFPEGVNTEIVEVIDRNTLKMRVWERGSGETLACGTGACAAAVAAVLNGYCDKGAYIKVMLPGGDLLIQYTDETVYMTGGCVKVFDGVIEI